VSRRIVERLDRIAPKKGATRDRTAQELIIGVAIGLDAVGYPGAEHFAIMSTLVNARGASFLEDRAKA
jgi:hypothetical protein